MHRTTNTSVILRHLKLSVFACAVVAFGLLLWARFLLVTGHPRTAIAEPPVQRQIATPEAH